MWNHIEQFLLGHKSATVPLDPKAEISMTSRRS
jgi:hypothetical protein